MLDGMRGEMIMRSYMALGGVVVLIFAAIFLFYTNSFLTKPAASRSSACTTFSAWRSGTSPGMLSVETLMLLRGFAGAGPRAGRCC